MYKNWRRSMKLAQPARCHHNSNLLLSTFHVKSCYLKLCRMHVTTQTTMAENFLESSCTTEDSMSIFDTFNFVPKRCNCMSLLHLLAAHHRILFHARFCSQLPKPTNYVYGIFKYCDVIWIVMNRVSCSFGGT